MKRTAICILSLLTLALASGNASAAVTIASSKSNSSDRAACEDFDKSNKARCANTSQGQNPKNGGRFRSSEIDDSKTGGGKAAPCPAGFDFDKSNLTERCRPASGGTTKDGNKVPGNK